MEIYIYIYMCEQYCAARPQLPRTPAQNSPPASQLMGMMPKLGMTELQLLHQVYVIFILAKIINPDREKKEAVPYGHKFWKDIKLLWVLTWHPGSLGWFLLP